ncbi:hypothetical protein RB601_001389 [Gaeumannomyces tritici]
MLLEQRTAALALLLACAGTSQAQRHGNKVALPENPHTEPLYRDIIGYSVEPVWVNDFISTDLMATLFKSITGLTGHPPPIRVGGNTADNTTLVDDGVLNTTAVAIPTPLTARRFNISRSWFKAWGDYFDPRTNLTYTLNMHENQSDWATARAQAEAAWRGLGTKLVRFELGNEIDHFINKGWRNSSWGVVNYVKEFRHVTSMVRESQWFREAGDKAPKWGAASFADPPWVPDQQDQLDDMDIINVTTRAGLVNEAPRGGLNIDSFVVHMYPMSTCDPARWHRMRLDLLSNHTTVWLNTSQLAPQVEASRKVGGAPLVMGETNSISCSGRSGISDTLGGALWNVDYSLTLAALGISHVYYHLGAMSEYSSFVPRDYYFKNESLTMGIRPGWYAHYFVAHVVKQQPGSRGQQLEIAALPGANSSDLSGFGVYGRSSSNSAKRLRKLVFLDMGVWNGTEGLSNPSTISTADNVDPAFHSKGDRPRASMTVAATPWCEGAEVTVVRMTGPGSNAKSGVRVSGVSFDERTGAQVGSPRREVVRVGKGGNVEFPIQMAEAVLLEVAGDGRCGNGTGGGGPVQGAASVVVSVTSSVMTVFALAALAALY